MLFKELVKGYRRRTLLDRISIIYSLIEEHEEQIAELNKDLDKYTNKLLKLEKEMTL